MDQLIHLMSGCGKTSLALRVERGEPTLPATGAVVL